MPDDHAALDRFVEQAGRLYSLPMVAMEILQLTSQPKVDLTQLKQCLQRDPALVGKILRVVNSSLFGLSREVSDLGQALALLGTKSVRLLVLGFSLPDELFVGLAGDILHRYWHHTAIKAAAAREISESIYRLPGEEPFIAGLLQDLGVLVLIQQLGEPYVKFLDRAYAKAVNVSAAETITLGFDHIQLSARLLRRWGLPAGLVAAIGVGNSPERLAQLEPTNRTLPQILHLADLLAGMLTEGRHDWLGELLEVGRQYHQLTESQLRTLVATLQEKVEQLAGVLSLELPDGLNYQDIFAEAHQQLSLAAEAAAIDLAAAAPVTDNQTTRCEDALLDDTVSLAEAVKKFAQRPQSTSAERLAAATSVRSPQVAQKSASGPFSAAACTSAVAATVDDAAAADSASPSQFNPTPNSPLERQVALAIAAARQTRRPLSLILVEIDRFPDILARRGEHEARRFAQLLGLICGRVEYPQLNQLPLGEGCFALVLADCDRPAAGDLGHQLLSDVRRLSQLHPDLAKARLSVSVGVATVAMPPKNFSPSLLIDSAQGCLHGAQLSGGNAVKSIDVL